MKKGLYIGVSLLTALSGCISHSLGDKEGSDRIVLTDASKRALTVVKVEPSRLDRRVLPHRIVCAEPSPDIATAVSSAIETTLKAKADVAGQGGGALDASLKRSFTESIAQLGARLATIQLLRDELSDLCRAYANGAVSSITYTLRLSRLDKKMITLLVSEASAGALSRALVSLNGASTVGGQVSDQKLKEAEDRVQNAVKALSSANADLEKANTKLSQATDESAKKAAKEEVAKAEEAVQNRLAEVSDRVIEKWALETRGSGLSAISTASSIASLPASSLQPLDLRSIHRAYLDDDDLGTLLDACLTSMEDNAFISRPINDEKLKKLKEEFRAKQIELETKRNELKVLDQEHDRQRFSATQQRPADDSKRSAVVGEMSILSLKLDNLQRDIIEEGGVQDRTALLSFCRGDGLHRITYLMERKMTDRSNLEHTRSYIDLCKAALANNSIKTSVQTACVNTLLRPGEETKPSALPEN
ncbi:MAG: hypothetical protein QM771_16140 [Nitrospira sp.]